MRFSDKTFVIMGATSGVGKAVAQKLSDEGAALVLCGRNQDKLHKTAAAIASKKYLITLDATSPAFEDELSAGLSEASKALGGVKFDGGVYCPGIAPVMPLRGINSKIISDTISVNYTGAVLFSKVMASKAYRANTESIIFISSVYASFGEKGMGAYGASKAALELSAKSFARELAPFGVSINCVSPGWLDTEMNNNNASAVAGLMQQMRAAHPMGLGTASDVASAVSFLLSDDAKWITGTTLVVDGGFLA